MGRTRKIILWILCVLSGVGIVISAICIWLQNKLNTAVSVIGRSDGPTSIFIAGSARDFTVVYMAAILLILVTALTFWLIGGIPIWDRTEVFFTMDMGEFARAERILSGHKIRYRSKIVRHTTRNNQMLGRIGENENCNATYAVYTEKKNAEEAKYHLSQEMGRQE